ncbi:MAG: hypothetical protein ACRAS9_01090 [Mycoplasma sp.]
MPKKLKQKNIKTLLKEENQNIDPIIPKEPVDPKTVEIKSTDKNFFVSRRSDFLKEKKKMNTVFIVILILVILGTIGIILYYFLK